MKQVTITFYTPEEKPPVQRRVRDKNGNIRDMTLLVETSDGVRHPACYTDQVDGILGFKVWHTKRPIKNVVMWAEMTGGEEI